jgi:hypothetical protein
MMDIRPTTSAKAGDMVSDQCAISLISRRSALDRRGRNISYGDLSNDAEVVVQPGLHQLSPLNGYNR